MLMGWTSECFTCAVLCCFSSRYSLQVQAGQDRAGQGSLQDGGMWEVETSFCLLQGLFCVLDSYQSSEWTVDGGRRSSRWMRKTDREESQDGRTVQCDDWFRLMKQSVVVVVVVQVGCRLVVGRQVEERSSLSVSLNSRFTLVSTWVTLLSTSPH